MYAPHSERDRYPKDRALDVECDDSVQLIPTHTLAPQVFPRLPPVPPPAPAPTPAPAQPAHPLHYIVSDPLDETRRQLTHHEFENLDAAALGSLRIEDVVPNRSFPGATLKYAIAPSRANAHRRPDSRRFVRPPSLLSLSPSAPSLSHSSSISPHTSPATSRGYSLPVADDPPPSQDPHPLSRESFFKPGHNVFTEEPKATEPSSDSIPAAAHSQPLPSPELAPSSDVPASSSSANVPSTSSGSGLGLPASSSSSTAMVVHSSSGGGKRSTRAPKRSPAPRRQECQTCGKKFQRPCQLTTHIRSHTGEQPHACPVCSRRFSVLSNCQRHVKLCQKRSVKPVLPGDDEVVSEPAQGSAFIQYPTEGTSAEVRRPNEVMIRPKPRTNGSGSGFGLGDAGASGSDVGTGKGKAETRKSRSASGSSASSLGAGEAPVIESSASGSGSSSGATVVPVVPSSPYPTGSTSAGPSYASGGSAYPGAQRGYAQAGEGFERSGPSYEQGYGQTTLSFDRSNSAYDPSRPGYGRPGSSYGPANAAGYDRLAPSGYASSPMYPGFEPSSAGYGQTPYAGSSMPSPSHIQPLSSPSHVQVQPLPSPSHVHIPSLPGPSMYGRPLMGGTPVVGSSIHDASPSSHSSYFHSPPGLYPSRSIPISRRPTIVPSLVQHAALGLSLGQPDNSMREPIGRRPSDAGAGPPSMPGGLGFSNAQMEGTGRPGIKQEDGTAGAGMWSNQETQGQLQGRGQEGERFRAGYQDARWAGAGVGSEPAGYNGYQSVSASGMVGSAGGYPYSQQSQQQLYAQQGGSGFGDSQEPYRSMEGGGTYAEGTAPFGMQAGVEGDMPNLPHQQFPDYPWPGSEGRLNHQ